MTGTEFPAGPDGAYTDEPGVTPGIPSAGTAGVNYYTTTDGPFDDLAGRYYAGEAHSEPFSARAPTAAEVGVDPGDFDQSLAWWSIPSTSDGGYTALGYAWTFHTATPAAGGFNSGMTMRVTVGAEEGYEELGVVGTNNDGNLIIAYSFLQATFGDLDYYVDTEIPYPLDRWVRRTTRVNRATKEVIVEVFTDEDGVLWSGSKILGDTVPGDVSYVLGPFAHFTARADHDSGALSGVPYDSYVDDMFASFATEPLRKYPRHDGRGMSPVRRGYPVSPANRLIGGQP